MLEGCQFFRTCFNRELKLQPRRVNSARPNLDFCFRCAILNSDINDRGAAQTFVIFVNDEYTGSV